MTKTMPELVPDNLIFLSYQHGRCTIKSIDKNKYYGYKKKDSSKSLSTNSNNSKNLNKTSALPFPKDDIDKSICGTLT